MASPVDAATKEYFAEKASANENGPKKAFAEVLAAGTAIGTTVTGVTAAGKTETTWRPRGLFESASTTY